MTDNFCLSFRSVPGLQRIANKLNIDCAAAITGFEYSTNGWSYPVKDGFVVCEEFQDVLLDAYNQVSQIRHSVRLQLLVVSYSSRNVLVLSAGIELSLIVEFYISVNLGSRRSREEGKAETARSNQ